MPVRRLPQRGGEATVKVSFSALDRIALCSASLTAAEEKPNIGSEESRRGTAVDRAYALVAGGGLVDWQLLANEHGIPDRAEEIREIVEGCPFPYSGSNVAWQVVVRYPYETFSVVGTADCVIDHGDTGEVWDIKTSELRGDTPTVTERLQVPGYALALARERGWTMVRAGIFAPLMPRSPTSYVDLGKDDLAEIERVISRVIHGALEERGRNNYVPGTACSFCPASATCPGLVREAKSLVVLGGESFDLPVPREAAPRLWAFRALVTRRVEHVEKWIKGLLESGPIQGADGAVLEYRDKRAPKTLSGKWCLEWLRARGYAELADQLEAEHGAIPAGTTRFVHLSKGVHPCEPATRSHN